MTTKSDIIAAISEACPELTVITSTILTLTPPALVIQSDPTQYAMTFSGSRASRSYRLTFFVSAQDEATANDEMDTYLSPDEPLIQALLTLDEGMRVKEATGYRKQWHGNHLYLTGGVVIEVV